MYPFRSLSSLGPRLIFLLHFATRAEIDERRVCTGPARRTRNQRRLRMPAGLRWAPSGESARRLLRDRGGHGGGEENGLSEVTPSLVECAARFQGERSHTRYAGKLQLDYERFSARTIKAPLPSSSPAFHETRRAFYKCTT